MVAKAVICQEPRRHHASAAFLSLAAAVAAVHGLSKILSEPPAAWVPPIQPTPSDVQAFVGSRGGAACARRQDSTVMRARHVAMPDVSVIQARKGGVEHKFDEDGGMYDIIKYPLLTEKACRLIEEFNTYTFLVDRRANKPQIRAAIETIFNVKVLKCNTAIPPAKYTIKFGRKVGRKSVFKKAMCRLKEGYSIDLFPDDPETPDE
mmetsp:Transcript_126840/g.353209  ORF Transcript_126840/g.353209 Transcript_126840/m.353209 type:complete len:206 (-) Transcript_126840:112-729(-)|eukprot:CAMPEP_0179077236 /NCGR_PEP_ID=MMETSP0796-20121207/34510_1 /TAXON_ID=73915 /ORGANISM="Pyrodinium bahamense, Strain pbaha01" /LENGTH=205 /DNA_ID=CAMNT_0020774509 /DNA_START=87 /DNA_END=704 /DNA_ORIENTATION=+